MLCYRNGTDKKLSKPTVNSTWQLITNRRCWSAKRWTFCVPFQTIVAASKDRNESDIQEIWANAHETRESL